MRKSRGRMSCVLNAQYVGRFVLYCIFFAFPMFLSFHYLLGEIWRLGVKKICFTKKHAKGGDC